jgi:hypothetical protein
MSTPALTSEIETRTSTLTPARIATLTPAPPVGVTSAEEAPRTVYIQRRDDEGFGMGIGEAEGSGVPVITELEPSGAADRSGLLCVLDRLQCADPR